MLSRIATLQQEMTEIERTLERLKSLGEDVYAVGSVLVFDKTFPGGGKTYHYAAIKCADGWYTTGPQSRRSYQWEELVDFMGDGVWKVYFADSLTEVWSDPR